jgi:hypothetical protein
MFPTTRTPRSLLAMAVTAAIATFLTLCEAMPLQMILPAKQTECLYEYADAGCRSVCKCSTVRSLWTLNELNRLSRLFYVFY